MRAKMLSQYSCIQSSTTHYYVKGKTECVVEDSRHEYWGSI